ncbi:hypothetical protein LWP59_28220 [Amycolatopsis acidiphila]|uniref:hypothetical protein n=1 Tax=Amycolatopsis acidiphila TaxID=715473 RepID=UPI0019AE0BE5|nr:hypothetical protein [Amycolatopsis acidiphila]UIJ57993.1 hypothetical protein LWP59_28220 [Amycolatopsis acidiphila]GHG70655.1 hypothetical protein GCM10017788_31980 [Amycolatopsis acidiphila]
MTGVESTLFLKGFIQGENGHDRIRTMTRPWRLVWSVVRRGDPNKRLNSFLAEAVGVVRSRFNGPVTYASGSCEKVDWSPFDIVGVNLCRVKRLRESYSAELRSSSVAAPTKAHPTRAASAGRWSSAGADRRGSPGLSCGTSRCGPAS